MQKIDNSFYKYITNVVGNIVGITYALGMNNKYSQEYLKNNKYINFHPH